MLWWNRVEMHTATFEQWERLHKNRVHRIGAPAAVHVEDSSDMWVREGKYHRIDGPAASSFLYDWYHDGLLHRIEGPALGSSWCIAGRLYVVSRPWQRRARRLRWLLHS